jgi:Family of unknown function (DUF6152)
LKRSEHALLVILGLVPTSATLAHHSAAMFDTSQEVVVEGTITRFDWKNPHIYMIVETTDRDGATYAQSIEAGAPSVLLPLGLTPSSLSVGERVAIRGNPNKNGERGIVLGRTLTKADGSELPLNIAARSVRVREEARATSLAGTWFSPLSSFGALRRGMNSWDLTDKGRAALASFDSREASYADCIPVTAPTLMVYPVATTIEVNTDTVVFNVDWMMSQRVVYLDGRGHPADGEPTLHGHSIGQWEGDTLVVDTTGYIPHKEGTTMGIPSGTGKHTVERFSLADGGAGMRYEVVVEDPEYLAEPIRFSTTLEYRPDLEPTGLACDVDVARRYLTDE